MTTETLTSEVKMDLGDRMKMYEKESRNEPEIDACQAFIIRLDGCSFSKLTKPLKKLAFTSTSQPYSDEFKRTMRLTAEDLLQKFSPRFVYTHSDEITMYFSPARVDGTDTNGIHPYNGKVSKLLSVTAGYTSVRFYANLTKLLIENKVAVDEEYASQSCFDARVIVFPQDKQNVEMLNHMIWRSKYDCSRNFVSMYAENYFSAKQLSAVSTVNRLKMLKDLSPSIDLDNYDSIDLGMKFGVYVKKIEHTEKIVNHESETVDVAKKDTKFFALPDIKCNESYFALLDGKMLVVADDVVIEEVKP